MQRVATELHAALAARSDVSVDTLALRASWRWTHVRAAPFMIKALARLYRTARERDTDVVLFSSMVTAALAVPLRRRLNAAGVKTATIVHGRDVTLPVAAYQRFVPRILQAQDVILPISRAVRQECLTRGARTSQLHRIPNGIDLRRYADGSEGQRERESLQSLLGLPLSPDALVLCSVGRQVPRKGFLWFVEHVMPKLPDHVRYVLIGEGPEGPAIAEQVRRLGLTERVHLLGRVDEDQLSAVYRGSDLFIMPNVPVPGDMEGFGVVMLEAGANGLPTIASGIEGIRDVIHDGTNGYLLDALNANAFASQISHFDLDRAALAEASARAKAHIQRTFDWSAIADRYVATLQTAVAGRKVAPVMVPEPTTEFVDEAVLQEVI